MFCSKCGSSIADKEQYCRVCGNKINEVDSEATVVAPAAPPVQPGFVQSQPVQQYTYAPAVETESTKKSGTGLKIGIAVMAVIAVIAIVFAVLLGTGTISFNKEEKIEEDVTVSKQEKTNEPEIGVLYDLPLVTANKSNKKVMLKMCCYHGLEGGEMLWFAQDNSDSDNPIFYFSMALDSDYGEPVNVENAIVGDYMYTRMEDPDSGYVTYKQPMGSEEYESLAALFTFFGDYEKSILKDYGLKYKYLGKEELLTGKAYIYECLTESGEVDGKMWIDADTGYWVRLQEDGKTVMEVSEIITDKDVEIPEFDFKNAELSE